MFKISSTKCISVPYQRNSTSKTRNNSLRVYHRPERDISPNISFCYKTRLSELVAVPLRDEPLYPGFSTFAPMTKEMDKAIMKISGSIPGGPYVGAFLLKDDPETDPSVSSCIEAERIYHIKGKALYDRLHKIGTFARFLNYNFNNEVEFMGIWRLRIIEMVSEHPLIVKVEHLEDKPRSGDDIVIKATSIEVLRIMRHVLNLNSKLIIQSENYLKAMAKGDNLMNSEKFDKETRDYMYNSWLADFGATIFGRSDLEMLAELDVQKRLKLSLKLAKKELGIIRRKKKSISYIIDDFSEDLEKTSLRNRLMEEGMDLETATQTTILEFDSVPMRKIRVTRKPTKGVQTRAGTGAKDPMKPKRPANAFIIFMVEFGKTFMENNSRKSSVLDVAKAGGEIWKQMTDAEKAPYLATAKLRKIEYNKSLLAFKDKLAEGGHTSKLKVQ